MLLLEKSNSCTSLEVTPLLKSISHHLNIERLFVSHPGDTGVSMGATSRVVSFKLKR